MSDSVSIAVAPPTAPTATALVPADPIASGAGLALPQPQTGISVLELAKHAFASGMFKKLPNPSAAVMILQFGSDLGLSATTSLTSIHFYDGKPSMSGNLMWSLVQRDPVWGTSRVIKKTNLECVVAWYRNGQLWGESSFTMEDAKLAGLQGKDNWRKWPRNMLFNRAISEGFRMYCPHLSMGYTVYTPDELGQKTDEHGEVIEDAAFTVAPTAQGGTPRERLDKVLRDSGVSREQVAGVLDITLDELDKGLTESELVQVQDFVRQRKALGATTAPTAA